MVADGTLLAGVAQHIEFEIFYGTGRSISDENSVLQLTCSDGSDLEFWVLFCKVITLLKFQISFFLNSHHRHNFNDFLPLPRSTIGDPTS